LVICELLKESAQVVFPHHEVTFPHLREGSPLPLPRAVVMRGLNPLPQGGGYEGPNQPSYLIKANLKLFSGLLWRTSHTLLPSLKPKKGHSWDALKYLLYKDYTVVPCSY